ncbi:MAG TPA: glycine zipper domain-containing protein [Methylomirabilota bacterium]|jgi:outer membrane lipoprotein SlyB|nr:glycine zipper domain-containing protein [Methylomirabilota bacterium]
MCWFVRVRKALAPLVIFSFLYGCSQPLSTREKSTLVGGGLGAATGAIIGSAVGSPGAGAAIGGALGAGTGALIGDQFQKIENRQEAQQRQINAQRRELRRQRREISRLKRKGKKKPDYTQE